MERLGTGYFILLISLGLGSVWLYFYGPQSDQNQLVQEVIPLPQPNTPNPISIFPESLGLHGLSLRGMRSGGTLEYTEVSQHRALFTAYCNCRICVQQHAMLFRTSIDRDAHMLDGAAVDSDPHHAAYIPYGMALGVEIPPKLRQFIPPDVIEDPGHPGFYIWWADDTGGAMRDDGSKGDYHIDLRLSQLDHELCRRFGAQHLTVHLLRNIRYREPGN